MKTENVVLMRMAKESLNGKWVLAIVTYLVYVLIVGSFASVGSIPSFLFPALELTSSLVSLIISGPFILGLAIFALSISRNKEARLEQIFQGFSNFGTALGAYMLITIFVILWMLLLIIPGIIAAISYSMTFFIIADDKSIGVMEAIDKSKKMMYGYKWKFFRLVLRLFGLALLCILTLGIGFLWLWPYAEVCAAKFYEDVKANSLATENI